MPSGWKNELMTTLPGLYAAGEANPSDHGANRLTLRPVGGVAGDSFVPSDTPRCIVAP